MSQGKRVPDVMGPMEYLELSRRQREYLTFSARRVLEERRRQEEEKLKRAIREAPDGPMIALKEE